MASIALPVIGWFVSPIISKVLEHGILHFKERWELEEGVPEEIDRLNKVLRLIKGVLEDAEQKQTENSAVLSWLGELKEVLYDAEDILDRYEVDLALMYKTDAEQLPTEMGWKAKVRSRFISCVCCCKSSANLKVAHLIKSINEKLEYLRKQGHEWGLRDIATSTGEQGNTSRVRWSRETTSPLADDSLVVGRADEKRDIVKMLFGDNKNLSVLPIIGMGGVGKTTLARLVYNDEDVHKFFKPKKAWVCIGMSQDLELRRLMIEIINSICSPERRNTDYSGCNLDILGKTIVEELIKDKQPFLLVLDDAWDTKVNNWNRFLEPLKAGGLTCRIIVTTRDQKVVDAIRIDRLEPIPLSFLKEDDMWNIFRRHAFGNETTDADPELEFIGRQIVQKLKGLPLAAEIIGGILYGNTRATDWRKILKNKLLEIKENENENYMLSILMLSYDSLSPDLKQCFSYCSLFPKDYTFVFEGKRRYSYLYGTIPVSRILYIWMSQKLTNIEEEIDPEDTGSEKIIQLSNKSLLQSIETKFGPSVTMHDLVHDLAEKIAKEEILCVSGVTEHNIPKKLRHISFFEKESDVFENADEELKILQDLRGCTTVRTLLFYKFNKMINNYTSILDGWFNSLIYLRALSLHNLYMTSLPESIGNLKLLRYLDINLPRMEKLPESVSSLYNLQVLLLGGCVKLSKLDDSLTRLVNLVNLDINGGWAPLKSIGKLTKLQHLEEFHVSRHDGHKVTELRNLNKICGSLHILNLENIEAKEEAGEAQLYKKDGLKELELTWGHSSGPEEVQLDVLEGLRPSRNLNKLSLTGYKGTHLPTWLNRENLPFLKAIELQICLKLKVLPPLTDCLNELIIFMSPRLAEMSSLSPKLQHLSLSDVGVTSLFSSASASHSLPSIPCLSSLRTLSIVRCPNLDGSLCALLKSFLPSLNSLEVRDYKHPLESFCYLTALTKLHLSSCIGKVGIDVRALVSLKDLTISFCPKATIEDPHPNSTPCKSLSILEIHSSPLLLRSLSQSRVLLSSLEKLEIKEDDLDESVLSGCLFHLTSLEKLVIEHCPNITSISEEALCRLVTMKVLEIKSCRRLEGLDLLALGSLQSLRIVNCPGFVFDCRPPQSSSNRLLRDVYASDISADQQAGLLSFLEHCSNVRSIQLHNETVTYGLGGICLLTKLEELSVRSCAGLPLEFPSLCFLKTLSIWNCPDVTSFPALSSLRKLEIVNCPNFTFSESPPSSFPSVVHLFLDGINVQQLTRVIMRATGSPLQFLLIKSCDGLISFDGDLGRYFLFLTSLRGLHISYCDHLQQFNLDLRGFKALRALNIDGCSQISSLHEEGLPISLRSLRLSGCPALEALYGQREGNPHWERISHIPYITI